jgi:hypothetical protein
MSEISIEIRRDVETVTSMGHHVPDTSWAETDSHGHVHSFDKSGELPSLVWTVTDTYWCEECRDEHEEGEWRCRLCDDVVAPKYGWKGPYSIPVPGLWEVIATVDGETFPVPLTVADIEELRSLSGDAFLARCQELAKTAATREP